MRDSAGFPWRGSPDQPTRPEPARAPDPRPFDAEPRFGRRDPLFRPAPPAPPDELRNHLRRLEDQDREGPPRWVLFGLPTAALVLAVGSLYWSVGLRNQLAMQQSTIETLEQQKQELADRGNAPLDDLDNEVGTRTLPLSQNSGLTAPAFAAHSAGTAHRFHTPYPAATLPEPARHSDTASARTSLPASAAPAGTDAAPNSAPASVPTRTASSTTPAFPASHPLPDTAAPSRSAMLQPSPSGSAPAQSFHTVPEPEPPAKAAPAPASETAAQFTPRKAASEPPAEPHKTIPISGGLMAGSRISGLAPLYPQAARAANVEGTVVLQATISKTGIVTNLRAVSGPMLLRKAALDAVKTWTYHPYLLDGAPVAVQTTVSVVFSLNH
jgi:protein TonB